MLSRRKSSTNAREILAANAPVKIVLLGKKGVGKSAITVRLLTRRFIGEYDPNLETSLKYITRINGEETISEIMDTAQRCNEDKILPCAQWADCFVLVYSIVDNESFNEIARIKKIIDTNVNCNLKPIVILANKSDLDTARQVSYDTGAQFASEVGCPYHEISARESYADVEKVFYSIIDMTVRCSMIKEQINRLVVTPTSNNRENRERRPSFKSIVKNLTRQKVIKEEMKEIKEDSLDEKTEIWTKKESRDLPPRKDSFPIGTRQRSSTCTF